MRRSQFGRDDGRRCERRKAHCALARVGVVAAVLALTPEPPDLLHKAAQRRTVALLEAWCDLEHLGLVAARALQRADLLQPLPRVLERLLVDRLKVRQVADVVHRHAKLLQALLEQLAVARRARRDGKQRHRCEPVRLHERPQQEAEEVKVLAAVEELFRGDADAAVRVLVEHVLTRQHRDRLVHVLLDRAGGEDELGFEHLRQRRHGGQQLGAPDCPVALHEAAAAPKDVRVVSDLEARVQRRAHDGFVHKEVQDLVAVVRELVPFVGVQHRLEQPRVLADEVAHRLDRALDDCLDRLLAKVDDDAAALHDGRAQPLHARDELAKADAAAAKREQDCPDERRRHNERGVVDHREDEIAERAQQDHLHLPVLVRVKRGPLQDLVLHVRTQAERLAEAHVDPPERELEHARAAQEPAERFLSLLGAEQLGDVGLGLEHAVVADRDRAHVHVLDAPGEHAVNEDLEHAKLGVEQLAGAASRAFDKRLKVVAVLEQTLDVLLEDGVVQRVVLERAADEERAAVRHERAEKGHVEVVAAGHERERDAHAVEQVRQHHVVDVRAMARREEQRHLLFLRAQRDLTQLHELTLHDVNALLV
eukprot:Unigene4375_Nuclearia_a/m.13358 Unigene4375_Nuclearia_a/g.13358  ORF Unigene4375_Nuclearia_a/g.13358 Unigene4375_Nuclearia_a/m.13358 type:complete len:594 (-) Unigene4375_Nuclearia_a:574-2355(-)